MTVKKNVTTASNLTKLGISAYENYRNILFKKAFDKAIGMGLQGTAATQYANSTIGPASTSVNTVSKILPFVGAGLSVYDIAKSGPNIYNVGGAMGGAGAGIAGMAGGSAGLAALPFALVGGAVAIHSWRKSQKYKHGRKYMFYQNTNVTPVKTEGDWVYLRLSEGHQPKSFGWTDGEYDTGLTYMFRYNTKTNKIQTTRGYQPSFTNKDSYKDSSRWNVITQKKDKWKGKPQIETDLKKAHPDLTIDDYKNLYKNNQALTVTKDMVFHSKRRGGQESKNKIVIYARDKNFAVPEGAINGGRLTGSNLKKMNRHSYRNFDKNKNYLVYYTNKKNQRVFYEYSFDKHGHRRFSKSNAMIVYMPKLGEKKWHDISQEPISSGKDNRHQLFWNIPQLQASIYNTVLAPRGFVEKITPQSEGWKTITSGGKQYLSDGKNVANMDGSIIGKINTETKSIESLNMSGAWRFDKDFKKPRNDAPAPYDKVGTIDNWQGFTTSFKTAAPTDILPTTPSETEVATDESVTPGLTPETTEPAPAEETPITPTEGIAPTTGNGSDTGLPFMQPTGQDQGLPFMGGQQVTEGLTGSTSQGQGLPFMGGQQTNNTSELSFMNTTNIFTPPTTTQGGLNIPDMNSLA
ncbi:MAG: hypothetical protein U9O94_03280, partial [Nanoarchaeota archaeon]|nr:hypothetical protein [Nanoarchaeota archaeon]